MSIPSAQEIYERYVSPLPAAERLRLLAIVAEGLASESTESGAGEHPNAQPRHNIMELYGLGKEIWEGIDAQAYVNRLRDEWERPTTPDAHK